MAAETILVVDGVDGQLDGFKALDDLSLTLERGELSLHHRPQTAAGKTTLMDGHHRQDPARSLARSIGRNRDRPHHPVEFEIARLGIGRKFQRPTVFQGHTVFENLELASRGPRGSCTRWSAVWAAPSGAHRRGAGPHRSRATACARATQTARCCRIVARPMRASTSSMRARSARPRPRTSVCRTPLGPRLASSRFSNTVCPWNTVGAGTCVRCPDARSRTRTGW